MKLRQILCGVDFSESSVEGFEAAVELARALQAKLHIIHVIEADPAIADRAMEEKAVNAIEALVASANELPASELTTEVTTGRASVEIVERARERGADLIVLGAKGIRIPEVFGSTADRVAKEAPCSVLIVRLQP